MIQDIPETLETLPARETVVIPYRAAALAEARSAA